jgi:hypothetical protein
MAVPTMAAEAVGAIVLWRLSGDIAYSKLQDAWYERGLDDKLIPQLPSPQVALHRAVNEQRESRRLVRPLDRHEGWAIVQERASKDDLDYRVALKVKLDIVQRPQFDPDDHPLVHEVRAQYERFLNTLTQPDISVWLSRFVQKLNAVPLRDTGGTYFIPQMSVQMWKDYTAAIEVASAHVCHEILALKSEEAVEVILDALTEETRGESEKMRRELPKLGARGLQARLERCEEQERKIEAYEKLLGTQQEKLRANLKKLKASIGAAMLVASGSDTDEEPVQLGAL